MITKFPTQLSLRSFRLNGVYTSGIQRAITTDNPNDLITNGAVSDLQVDTDARLTTLEGWVDQDVSIDANPTFQGVTLTASRLNGGSLYSTNTARIWYQLTDDITNDGYGKFAYFHVTGRYGSSFDPCEFTYKITRTTLGTGGIVNLVYDCVDSDISNYPQFLVYRNPADGIVRVYMRPELNSRYSIIITSNSYLVGHVVSYGSGALPSNIDGTWTLLIDTDDGYPVRTFPPNSYKQYGRLLLTSTVSVPDYALYVNGDAYLQGAVVSATSLRTNQLLPGGLTAITSYQEGTGVANVTGALITTVTYKYSKLNSTITLRVDGVLDTAVADSPIIIALPAIATSEILSSEAINVNLNGTIQYGTCTINSAVMTIYSSGSPSNFVNGQLAGFYAFHETYFTT